MPDEAWGAICDLGAQLGRHVVMEKAPDEFKQHNDVFGKRRPEWKIMHRIKAALDPHHIFARGRLPGRSVGCTFFHYSNTPTLHYSS